MSQGIIGAMAFGLMGLLMFFALGMAIDEADDLKNIDYKRYEHRGIIQDIQIVNDGLWTKDTIIRFQDGAVYQLDGIIQGLIIGEEYSIWHYKHFSTLYIERNG